jgi:monovalent cation:H+ antiporter-2, CPA2 family
MGHFDLIITITGGLFAALIFAFGMHRVGLSPIVGYLLAGVAVGPFTPGFVANESIAGELAEIGVILLMFGVGLQFHLEELLSVRRIAGPGALVGIAVSTGFGVLAARALGWVFPADLLFGLCVCVASTVVLVRVLSDAGDLHTPKGRVAIGWLVVEDIFTVLALVALPLVFARDARSGSLWLALGFAALKLVGFVAFMLVVGQRAIPRLFEYAAKTRSRELFSLTVLVTALGIAVGSAKLFGASMALGAFLAGTIVGQSEFSARAATDALPMRDAFAVLFFVSVGMMFDPVQLFAAPLAVAATLGIVLFAKPAAAWLVMRALSTPARIALPVAVSLAQIGEFSFVLAGVGQKLELLPVAATSMLVATSIISITLNPLLYRAAVRYATRNHELAEAPKSHVSTPPSGRDVALVVGYGPTGQIVRDILRQNAMDAVVIDLNLATVRALSAEGHAAVYGDAASETVLRAAGIERAVALFLTASALEHSVEMITNARRINPSLRVYVRAQYLREVDPLRRAGARTVVAAEGEVALAMATALLDDLGASPDQIERERDRVHEELVQRAAPG